MCENTRCIDERTIFIHQKPITTFYIHIMLTALFRIFSNIEYKYKLCIHTINVTIYKKINEQVKIKFNFKLTVKYFQS